MHLKGTKLFSEIENSLKALETRYIGVTLNIQGSSKKFSDIEEMLKQEKSQFEVRGLVLDKFSYASTLCSKIITLIIVIFFPLMNATV